MDLRLGLTTPVARSPSLKHDSTTRDRAGPGISVIKVALLKVRINKNTIHGSHSLIIMY